MADAIREECRRLLAQALKKEVVLFTDTFLSALFVALRYAKDAGYHRILVPDQGGFIPSQGLLEKLEMTATVFPTKTGSIDLAVLKEQRHAVLLAPLMPAFSTVIDVEPIRTLCSMNDLLFIADARCAVGSPEAEHAPIVIASFLLPPLDVGSGAFLAGTEDLKEAHRKYFKKAAIFEEDVLYASLQRLQKTRDAYLQRAREVKKDLFRFDVIHRFFDGWNVLVATHGSEKETLIKYCEQKGYPYLLCPDEERMLVEGISIELVER